MEPSLDPRWPERFWPLRVMAEPDGAPGATVLEGPLPDQAALRGMLARLWDLNLTVLSVERLEGEAVPAGTPARRTEYTTKEKGERA